MKLSTVIAGTFLLGACSQSAVNPNHGSGRADSDDTWTGDDTWRPIGPRENPNDLVDHASRVLSDNITADDVGKSFGTDDAHIPYPDTYWPFVDQGVDAAWNGDSTPLDKYFAVTDPSKAMDGKNWEHANHGRTCRASPVGGATAPVGPARPCPTRRFCTPCSRNRMARAAS